MHTMGSFYPATTYFDNEIVSQQQRHLFGSDGEEDAGTVVVQNPWLKYPFETIKIIPHYTGALSIVGSAMIMTMVLCDKKKGLNRQYHRLVFAMSFLDFLMSFWLFLGHWAQPQRNDFFHGTGTQKGNVLTCDAMGFFYVLGSIAIPLYNTALAIQFYLFAVKRWSERKVKVYFDKFVHIIIMSFSMTLAIVPLPFKGYNTSHFFCTVSYYYFDGEERGSNLLTQIYVYLTLCTVLLSSIIVTGTMMVMYIRFRKAELNSNKYQFVADKYLNKRSKMVLKRALQYALPFYVTWVVPTVHHFVVMECLLNNNVIACPGPRATFILQVWMATFMPMQGFFNAIVFFLPDLTNMYKKKKKKRNGEEESGSRSMVSLFNMFDSIRNINLFDKEAQMFDDMNKAITQQQKIGNDDDGTTTQAQQQPTANNDAAATTDNNNHYDNDINKSYLLSSSNNNDDNSRIGEEESKIEEA